MKKEILYKYTTDDGKTFTDEKSALEHEEWISKHDEACKKKYMAYEYIKHKLIENGANGHNIEHDVCMNCYVLLISLEEDMALMDIFDNMVAGVYSGFDLDIHEYRKKNKRVSYNDLDSEIKDTINKAIESMLKKYPKVLELWSFDLCRMIKCLYPSVNMLTEFSKKYGFSSNEAFRKLSFMKLKKEDFMSGNKDYIEKKYGVKI